MIKSVRLKNFKLFKEAEIPLERFTVFVGPNGSGKTTVLEALDCLTLFARHGMGEVRTICRGRLAPSQLRRKGATEPVEIECAVERNARATFVRCSFVPTEESQTEIDWNFQIDGGDGALRNSHMQEIPVRSDSDDTKTGINVMSYWTSSEKGISHPMHAGMLLRLDPQQIARPSETGRLQVDESGYGIASVLQDMALSRPDQFSDYQESIRSVIKAVRRIRMTKATILRTENLVLERGDEIISKQVGRKFDAYRLVLDMANADEIIGDSVSEGTLLVVGMLTMAFWQNGPRLMLIDDIDRGLHPMAMADLIRAIRLQLDKDPELQIVATSHSPYLLDQLKFEEVRLTTLDSEGYAHVGNLSDHADFAKWKEFMTPGEFWSMVGESWIATNGKPANA